MKKIIRLALVSILFLLAVFVSGCFDKNTNNNNSGNNGLTENPKTEEQQWFFLQNLKYNTAYSSYGEGQGFFIYDEIDFNDVQFSSHVDNFTVKFDIFHEEEKTTVGIGQNAKFGIYVFRNAGQYAVKVSGKDEDGKALKEEEFKCNVAIGNRPDRVEFVIKNGAQETVDRIKGGDSYTVTAKLFSQEKEYVPLAQDIYWSVPGVSQYTLSLGNIFKQESRKGAFYCFIRNNNNKRIRVFEDESLIIYDNLEKTAEFPQGIYYNFGVDISGGLELNVDAAIPDKPFENNYFYRKIRAEYRFDNGDTLPLELADERGEGKLSMFISYDEESPQIYSVKKYDYSFDAHGNKRGDYFSNGVKYQFDPTKTSAKIYLAVWALEDNKYVTSKVEGTDIDLRLISEAPSALTVTSVSGSHKNDAEAFKSDYKPFEKTPENGAIDVYLCCDMDGDNKISDEYEGKLLSSIRQYFILNVSVTGGNLKDYTMIYTVERYGYPAIERLTEQGYSDPFFVAPNVGTSTVTIKSMFSEHEYMLTVNVIDKVFEDAKGIENIRGEDGGYAVFSKVDFRSFLKIKEYKLSDYDENSYVLRLPREDEIFEYSINDTVIEPDEFSYQNNNIRGHEITVSIKGASAKISINRLYIIPDFEFSVNGVSYRLKELEETIEYVEELSSFPNSQDKWFYGRIPVLNIQGDALDFDITNHLEMENRSDMSGEPRYGFQKIGNKVVVTYMFDYINNSKLHIYQVEILNINLL